MLSLAFMIQLEHLDLSIRLTKIYGWISGWLLLLTLIVELFGVLLVPFKCECINRRVPII